MERSAESCKANSLSVLWISHLVPYPPKGGVRQRSYYLLREAAKRYRVDFVGLAQTTQQSDVEELRAAREHIGTWCHEAHTFWIKSDRRPLGRTGLLARSFFSTRPFDVNWFNAQSMHGHLRRRGQYDLIHLDTLGLTPYASHYSDAPVILNHHNIESQMMEDRADEENNPMKRIYMTREASKLRKWETRWASRATVNTVVSSLDRDRLIDRVPRASVQVVDNGVDTDYFSPRSEPEANDGYLVFVGGMSWYPNRDAVKWFVREIWPLLLADNSRRRALLIGRDPPTEVREASQKEELAAPGFIDDIRPAVDRAMAYVCPIRKGGGTRLKILDALAMAKPLVATAFAVEGLGLEKEEHYLRAENPEEYVKQINRLEASPDLRRRLGKSGRAFVEQRYAWPIVGKKLAGAYELAFKNSARADHSEYQDG